MRIGLTYDLKSVYLAAGYSEEEVAEFDSEETIQALAETLKRLGHTPVFIGNIFALAKQLCSRQTWDLVFNLTEGLFGRSREAQVPALLEAYQLPYTFSDPLTLAAALDKGICKRIVRAAGIQTPDFFLVEEAADANRLLRQAGLAFPLFTKPIAEGTGKGISARSVIKSDREFAERVHEILACFRQPVLVESYLPGREYTVGILGSGKQARVLGVLEILFGKQAEADVYSFMNKKEYISRVEYRLVTEATLVRAAGDLALAAYRALGCRDAGRVDLRADGEGALHFLEINPLAGLHPQHSDLPILAAHCGLAYDDLIAGILQSAAARIKPLPAEPVGPATVTY
ncbi:D-alanine--D-alanine ligase [candidate division FCPU426 bacterium]|nr:D-alanine--D-alanine ligase [candidate division FCPU426 bacterium]